MRLPAHRPDARASCAVLLYEGDGGRPDPYRHRPRRPDDDQYDDDGYHLVTGVRDPREHERDRWAHERNRWAHERRPSGPPPATQAVRDSLTRWPESLFHAEPYRVVALDTAVPENTHQIRDTVHDAHDLLLVHYAGALDIDDSYRRTSSRGRLPFDRLFDVIGMAAARHVVVVVEPDRATEIPPAEAFHHRYAHLMRHFQGRLTLIVADPVPGYRRPFLADALGDDGPLSAHKLAAHPRAQVLTRADGRDVQLTGSARRGGRKPLSRQHPRTRERALARTRSSLTKARESTASALSAAALPALLLLAVAVVAGGLFALLRTLPPLRGTWGAAALFGLWVVLAAIGAVGLRQRTPPARARPPGDTPPVPPRRAFVDGMWAAWGFSGPLPDPAGRPRQPVPPRPTREESRAAVERSLDALYARLPVPQMRAPDPPVPSARPAPPSSPSPDDNGTTP